MNAACGIPAPILRDVCPHCGAITISTSFDGKTAYCWMGHAFPNS